MAVGSTVVTFRLGNRMSLDDSVVVSGPKWTSGVSNRRKGSVSRPCELPPSPSTSRVAPSSHPHPVHLSVPVWRTAPKKGPDSRAVRQCEVAP